MWEKDRQGDQNRDILIKARKRIKKTKDNQLF